MTVEASFVMAVVLFTCMALVKEGFQIHSRTTGMLILMDAAEQVQSSMEKEQSEKECEDWANRALKAYYRCGDRKITLNRRGQHLEGSLKNGKGETEGMIEIELFDPERFLRMVRALGD